MQENVFQHFKTSLFTFTSMHKKANVKLKGVIIIQLCAFYVVFCFLSIFLNSLKEVRTISFYFSFVLLVIYKVYINIDHSLLYFKIKDVYIVFEEGFEIPYSKRYTLFFNILERLREYHCFNSFLNFCQRTKTA